MSLEDEINAIIAELPKHQLDALKDLIGEPEAKPTRRGIPPKDKNFEAEVTISCNLCGSSRKETWKSASPLSSMYRTPTCSSCAIVLGSKTVEELVIIAIRAADGCWAEVKDLKAAADQFYAEKKAEGEQPE